jgi:hypothetical protein
MRHHAVEVRATDSGDPRSDNILMRGRCHDDPEFITEPHEFDRVSRRIRRQVEMRMPVADEGHEPHQSNEHLIVVQVRNRRVEILHRSSETVRRDGVESFEMTAREFIGQVPQVGTPRARVARSRRLLRAAASERERDATEQSPYDEQHLNDDPAM